VYHYRIQQGQEDVQVRSSVQRIRIIALKFLQYHLLNKKFGSGSKQPAAWILNLPSSTLGAIMMERLSNKILGRKS